LRPAILAVLLLGILAAPLPAAPPEPIDILSVTPESLAGEDPAALSAEANGAYQERRYEDAARAFIRLLRQKPGDASTLYNLACCYGLLGHDGHAAKFLDAAWNAGFHDIDHIRRDPDFDKVRDFEPFRELLARLGAESESLAKSAGKQVAVAAPVMADVRVIEPTAPVPEGRRPLLVGLHGFGSNADSFARMFSQREIPHTFLWCVVRAPYAFPSEDPIGYSWSFTMPGTDWALAARSEKLASDLVLQAIEAVKREFPVDERNVFLLGFSQGAGLAFSIGLDHPALFRGVIPIGGWLDPAAHDRAKIEKARKGLFLVCHSPEDRMVPYESATKAVEFLAEHRIPHAQFDYEGGHSVPKDLLGRIVAWVADPVADAVGPRPVDK
jgi:phospholipase/carboxylesterase